MRRIVRGDLSIASPYCWLRLNGPPVDLEELVTDGQACAISGAEGDDLHDLQLVIEQLDPGSQSRGEDEGVNGLRELVGFSVAVFVQALPIGEFANGLARSSPQP